MAVDTPDSLVQASLPGDRIGHSEFMQMFPSDASCLEYLKRRFYPDGTTCARCAQSSKFHRIAGRSAYSCQFCGTHVYPTAGTIFEGSSLGLRLWFWAIFLMSSTGCEISAKQLERELGVTYKTAHRMYHRIRPLITEDEEPPRAFQFVRAKVSLPSRSVWDGRARRADVPPGR